VGLLLVAVCGIQRADATLELVRLAVLPRSRRRPRVQKMACAALVVGILAVAALLGPIYWHMLRGPGLYVHNPLDTSTYTRLVSAAGQAKSINPSEVRIDELRLLQQDAEANQLLRIYRQPMSDLVEPGGVPLDLKNDARYDYTAQELPTVQSVRSLVRAWSAEAEHAAQRGSLAEAADYGLASVHAGSTFGRGGLPFHTIFGAGLEGVGIRQLCNVRKKISITRARELLSGLRRVDGDREPFSVALARDKVWVDEVFGWRLRLAFALSVVTGREFSSPDNVGATLRKSINRRDAHLRLLMADLAIRLFESDQERLPLHLSEMVPEYLAEPPIDPFSQRPLIYRHDGDSYVLYSAGPDGRDDGGRDRRLDLSLDSLSN
jgi:hypothetical protein